MGSSDERVRAPTETRPPAGVDRDHVGEVVGGWKLESRLGRGGMGSVYRATRGGRTAAVKVLARGLDGEAGNRFRRESALLRRMDHPAIVSVFDDGIDGDAGFFVMELVEGEDLRVRLERGRMPLEEIRVVFPRILDALSHAHSRGVIHRDLKPANVVQAPDGAKLVDFGIAQDDSATRLTGTAAVIGTFAYMSPEQRAGAPVGPGSDLFSFGVMLYEALTGQLPQGAFAPPSRVASGIPSSLDGLVERLLQPDPGRRFTTAKDVARALDRAIGSARHLRRLASVAGYLGAAVAAAVLVTRIAGAFRAAPDRWESTGGPGTGTDGLGVSDVLAAGNGVLYAATNRGPYKRAGSCAPGSGPGTTWCRIASGLDGANPTKLLDSGDRILVATNGLDLSTDHGAGVLAMDTGDELWKPAGIGGPRDSFAMANLEGLFAGDGNFCTGVFRLPRIGERWEDVSGGLDPDRSKRRDRCVNAIVTDGEFLYAGSGVTGVFRSNRTHSNWDASSIAWLPLPPGLPDGNVRSLHRPVRGGPLLVGTNHCGLWSWQEGPGWASLGAPMPMVETILVRDGGILAGGSDRRMAWSPDRRTWYDLTEGLPSATLPLGPETTLASLTAMGDTCFAALGGVVYRRDCSRASLRRTERSEPLPPSRGESCDL